MQEFRAANIEAAEHDALLEAEINDRMQEAEFDMDQACIPTPSL